MSSKYWYILTTVIISLGLFNSGCLQLEKFSFGQSKTERINILEEEVESLSNNIGSLTTENYELKKNVVKLETAKNQLNKEYTQIKDKQIAIEAAQTSQNKVHKNLEGELAETKNLLEKAKQQLAIVENDKNNLKAKLEKLEASREKVAETEVVAAKATAAEEEKGNVDENRENLTKETQETSPVEDLLDKAIQLYREENFEEAIAKWEEVLALDPGKLEAKFNIEIAQDRIKEKQIQEDLKSSRIQRR
jgi:tetratricopeptide (TPR) repeat protein